MKKIRITMFCFFAIFAKVGFSQNPISIISGSGYIGTFGGALPFSPYHNAAWWILDSVEKIAVSMHDTLLRDEVFKTRFELQALKQLDSVMVDVLLWDHAMYNAFKLEDFKETLENTVYSNQMILTYVKINRPDAILFDGEPAWLDRTNWDAFHKRQKKYETNSKLWRIIPPKEEMSKYELDEALVFLMNDSTLFGMEDTLMLNFQKKMIYSDSANSQISQFLVEYRSLKSLVYAAQLAKKKNLRKVTIVVGSGHASDYVIFSGLVPFRYNLLNKTRKTNQELLRF